MYWWLHPFVDRVNVKTWKLRKWEKFLFWLRKWVIYKFMENYQWKMLYSFFTFNFCRQELARGMTFFSWDWMWVGNLSYWNSQVNWMQVHRHNLVWGATEIYRNESEGSWPSGNYLRNEIQVLRNKEKLTIEYTKNQLKSITYIIALFINLAICAVTTASDCITVIIVKCLKQKNMTIISW